MSKFLVITGPGASLGFRCAGIECREASSDEDISSLLSSLQAAGAYGLVAIDERLLERASEAVMRRIRKRGLPVIVPVTIPEKWGSAAYGESPVVRLIRRAIGYQIKIKR